MKKIIILCSTLAAMAFMAGCSKDSRLPDAPITNMSFTDMGYFSGDGSVAYQIEFSEGDKIGLFAVEDGKIVETVNNLCITATLDGNSLLWMPSDVSMLFPQEATYYAYYPYQEDFSSPVNAVETSAEGFFADFISSWTVSADQSGDAFKASDLMVGSASVESSALDVTLSHKMGMVAVELPAKIYRFTNTDYQIPDYSLSGTPVFNDFTPYSDGGQYLYVVKPGDFHLSGSVSGEAWTLDGTAAAGAYVQHSEGESEVIEHNLQIGDFFLADGTLLSKDAPASEVGAAHVIGIVCQYDPERIAEGEREALGGTAHALVLATKTAGGGVLYRFYTDYAIQDTDFDHCYVRDEEGEIGFPRVPQVTDLEELCRLADENIDGYYATHLIYTERAEDLAAGNYPGFKAVQDYAAEVGGPVEGLTTGWFMPAGGQYLDAIRNICDIELDAGNVSPSGSFDGTMTWFNMGTLSNLMNAAMSKVSYSNKTDYQENQNGTMIACEASDDCHRYIDIANQGWVDYMCFWKFTTTSVRPMLAF